MGTELAAGTPGPGWRRPPTPHHPLGFRTHSSYPPGDDARLGLQLDARPSLDEVLAARADRQAVMRGILDGLTDDEQARECAAPRPGYPDEVRTVGRCLRVVMREEIAHRLYAARDLAVLEERAAGAAQEPV